MINEEAITIFTPAWGQRHLDYLRDYAMPSVMQAGNLPACGWSRIFMRGASVGLTEPLGRVLVEAFAGVPGVEFIVNDYSNHENALLQGLKDTIRHCITSNTRMLLVMPDVIFSKGGIFNMRQYARGKVVSVAAPHLRVTEPPHHREMTTAADLVSHALYSKPHQATLESYSDKDHGTLTGGISLTRISDRLTTIIHYLPTVYLAWFTESDAAFFEGVRFFGGYDHDWGKHLDNEGRLRVVSDSDFFFAVELTDPAANRIIVEPGSKLEEHSTFGHLPLKAFVGTLKG